MKPELLTQIQNAEINVQPYAPKLRALPTEEETNQRRESLKKSGQIKPIIITEDENHNPLIVDGYLRYNLISELNVAPHICALLSFALLLSPLISTLFSKPFTKRNERKVNII